MNYTQRNEHEQFENDVRRIARQLWPIAEFCGAGMEGGRETDGIFDTEDCRHVVEATTSRRKAKAEEDIKKLVGLIHKLKARSGTRVVRGWFITRDEPTADQRQVANRHRDIINTLSFSQFQARLVDSRTYLSLRDQYAFGSVRDPGTGQRDTTIEYVSLDLAKGDSRDVVSRSDIVDLVSKGNTVVLLGDYGAGKSMTLREIYRDLRKSHLKGETSIFPVLLNLRDHYGQSDPSEVLHRHARSIGFSSPSHLVRAWRAGYVHLVLDGFDEISTVNIQGLWRKLKDNRYRAMEAVRRLIGEHPEAGGLLVAGRAHFFDNPAERRRALGLPVGSVEVSLNEFTESQITTYLQRSGFPGTVPAWLPSRPLLVGYLAATGLLADLKSEKPEEQLDPVVGWDILLDRVARREAEIEAGIDGPTVRKILERLATRARFSQSGLGPISQDAVIQAFRDVCGYGPDDQGMVLLQRLPGLGVDREEENSRIFVDEAFVDACRAGDLVAFVRNPFDFDAGVLAEMESATGSLGIAIACRRAEANHFPAGKVNTALEQAQQHGRTYMVADLARMLLNAGFSLRRGVSIYGAVIPELELGGLEVDVSELRFRDCFFARVELDSGTDDSKMPFFGSCFIEDLEGRVSRADLPPDRFDEECIIENYVEAVQTTASVLMLSLPLGTRVCITVLKKIYERRGSGRKENGLYRGMDHRARRVVPEVLRVLQTEGLAFPCKRKGATIWLPGRDRRRASRIVAAPNAGDDPVLTRCAAISG